MQENGNKYEKLGEKIAIAERNGITPWLKEHYNMSIADLLVQRTEEDFNKCTEILSEWDKQ